MQTYFDPLRPHRATHEISYEFTHGQKSLMAYKMDDLSYVAEIPVGPRPDCHATTCSGRYVYLACEDGLYAINTSSLEIAAHLACGHVYGTNMLPDGCSMLLHDAYGGILLIRNVEEPEKLSVERRLDVLGKHVFLDTLGGKGDFLPDGMYLCCGWSDARLFQIDTQHDFTSKPLTDTDARLFHSDDLVLGADGRYAFCACYGEQGTVAVVDVQTSRVVQVIASGRGTCGMTSIRQRRYAVASNDGDSSMTVVDTITREIMGRYHCRNLFSQFDLQGTLQGISAGRDDAVYIYDCSGNGALACFSLFADQPTVTLSCKLGKVTASLDCQGDLV